MAMTPLGGPGPGWTAADVHPQTRDKAEVSEWPTHWPAAGGTSISMCWPCARSSPDIRPSVQAKRCIDDQQLGSGSWRLLELVACDRYLIYTNGDVPPASRPGRALSRVVTARPYPSLEFNYRTACTKPWTSRRRRRLFK